MKLRTLALAAALLHLALAVAIFIAARKQIAPRVVASNGVISAVGVDSQLYGPNAIEMAEALRQHGLKAWAAESFPLHVRIISLCFAALGPLLGYSTLAAEPYNLVCYVAVVLLAFVLARELGGERAARLAAVVVGLWPTFLLHTTQFLKDAMFVAGALAIVFVVVTWLTRTYAPRHAAGAGIVAAVVTVVLMVIRAKFLVVVLVLALLGLLLLIVRMIAERRLLHWNLVCSVAIIAALALLTLRAAPDTLQRSKSYPSSTRGEAKVAANAVPTATVWRPAVAGRLDKAALMLGSVRVHYNAGNSEAGSSVDDAVELHSARDVRAYLPRAFALGMWSPYPSMWLRSGQKVGRAGRLLSGAETLAIYVCQLLALVAVIVPPRRLGALLLLVLAAFGVTMLGLVVSNVGTIYRFRYTFWILLIIAGASGAVKLWALTRRRAAAMVVLASLLVGACAQPHRAAGARTVAVYNLTGYAISAVYLSPSATPAWEENVLGGGTLRDGDIVEIDLRGGPLPPRWDLRVDGHGYRAEWRDLELTRISAIDLIWGNSVVVAELEPSGGR